MNRARSHGWDFSPQQPLRGLTGVNGAWRSPRWVPSPTTTVTAASTTLDASGIARTTYSDDAPAIADRDGDGLGEVLAQGRVSSHDRRLLLDLSAESTSRIPCPAPTATPCPTVSRWPTAPTPSTPPVDPTPVEPEDLDTFLQGGCG